MKKVFFLLTIALFTSLSAKVWAQKNTESAVLERVELLNNTVFGTKDSTTLDGLFAKQLTYGHSSGKVEDRQEALLNATVRNRIVYQNPTMSGFEVFFSGDAAIVRYILAAEQVAGNNISKLNLGMLQVWVKEGKQWKLAARQAVKVPV
jgi:hypothetical protein